ncbi:MAG: hypothetical protein LBH80_07130 [Prevotellaceae bacterium]|nr:hypothetical protein [Prevotellaceae bacterium]
MIWWKLKAFFISKNVLSFLFFLFLSFCFWFANALNKERETNINLPVRYIGLPQDIAITNNPPNTITITVAEEGLRLFSYRRSNITPLLLDVNKHLDGQKRMVIGREQIYSSLSSKLLATTSVIKINPDSIVIEIDKLHSKVLPIELVADIKTASQYYIMNDIRVIPDSVTVSGTFRQLDSLTNVKTEAIVLNKLNNSISSEYKLQTLDFLRYSVDNVSVEIDVDRFTEKQLIVPITTINVPEGMRVITFPATVQVTYNVGMSLFNMINEDGISAIFDCQKLIADNDGKMKLELQVDTKNIFNVRMEPDEVEFLLENN